MLSPAEAALRGKIGAHRLHASHDARQTTAKARETFLARFEREVDPDRVLPEGERRRRAEHARRAYFTRLSLASARARSRKRGPKHAAMAAVSETAPNAQGRRDATDVARDPST